MEKLLEITKIVWYGGVRSRAVSPVKIVKEVSLMYKISLTAEEAAKRRSIRDLKIKIRSNAGHRRYGVIM